MVGWNKQLILSPFGDRFRMIRRLLRSHIGGQDAVNRFSSVQQDEAAMFLNRLHAKPDELLAHIRAHASAVLLRISHGYRIQTEGRDPFVYLNETAAKEFSIATRPGWIVDNFRFLEYLPEWIPGMQFKKIARRFRETLDNGNKIPYEFVLEQLRKGTAEPSFTSAYLAEGAAGPAIEIGQCAAGAIYAGGMDTLAATIYTFFLVMTLFPSAQVAAQQEIDRVIGRDRLPLLTDRPNLPYVNALYKEILRWHTIGPMGIPHRVEQDDYYNGFLIPQGSLVFTNLWQIAHDANNYHDPGAFNPERFLGSAELDPTSYVFGFGRRRCPGQALAESITFLAIAVSLAVFEVKKPEDEPLVNVKFTSGTVSYPEPFHCEIKPRFEGAASLFKL